MTAALSSATDRRRQHRRHRPHLVPASRRTLPARRQSRRPRGDRRLQGEGRHRHVQLRRAMRRVAVDPETRRRRDSRLRDRRGRRQAHQSDGRRRPDLRRHGAGHRHRALRRDAVRRRRPAARLDASPTTCCRADRSAGARASITWRRRRPIPHSARRASAKAARSRRRRRSPTPSTMRSRRSASSSPIRRSRRAAARSYRRGKRRPQGRRGA